MEYVGRGWRVEGEKSRAAEREGQTSFIDLRVSLSVCLATSKSYFAKQII